MTKNAKLMMAAAVVLTSALAGCGKHAAAPQAVAVAPAPAQVAGPALAKTAKVSFFGTVSDAGWYFVVTSPNPNTKPLAILVDSKESCDRTVIKFSLKAVDPASKSEPPKSWCLSGKDLRAQLGA